MKIPSFFIKLGTILFFVLAVLSLGLCYFFPIYLDEFVYKVLYTRLFLDGGRIITAYPQCAREFLQEVPIWAYPMRSIDALLLSDFTNPSLHRLLGLCFFITEIIFTFLILRTLPLLDKIKKWLVFAFGASFFFLGVLPFQMAMVRPEAAVLLALLLILVLYFNFVEFENPTQARLKNHNVFILILGCVLAAFSYHVKVLFFLPMILLLLATFPVSFPIRLLGMAGVLFFARLAFAYFDRFAVCKDYPFVAYIYTYLMISPSDFFHSPLDTVIKASKNLINVSQYFKNMYFYPSYESIWLPSVWSAKIRVGALIKWFMVGYFFFSWGLIISSIWKAFLKSQSTPTDIRQRTSFTIGVFIFIGMLGWACMQSGKNFYEAALFVPFFLLAVTLILNGLNDSLSIWLHSYFIKLSIGLAILSQCYLLICFGPFLPQWSKGGFLEIQPSSFSHFHFSEIRKEIITAASLCGIKPDQALEHLVIDDLTYSVFWKTKLPYYSTYLGNQLSSRIPDLRMFLRNRGSPGLVAT